MTGKSIGTSMGFGFKGNYSRGPDDITVAKPVYSGSENIPFGMPVVQNADNTFSSPETTTLTTGNFGGFALAIVKQLNSYPATNNAPATVDGTEGFYRPLDMLDALKRGCMVNRVVYGTPGAGGQVYVRTVLNTGTYPDEVIGDIRASADGSNTIAVPNCIFETGVVDANDIVEIRLTKQNI